MLHAWYSRGPVVTGGGRHTRSVSSDPVPEFTVKLLSVKASAFQRLLDGPNLKFSGVYLIENICMGRLTSLGPINRAVCLATSSLKTQEHPEELTDEKIEATSISACLANPRISITAKPYCWISQVKVYWYHSTPAGRKQALNGVIIDTQEGESAAASPPNTPADTRAAGRNSASATGAFWSNRTDSLHHSRRLSEEPPLSVNIVINPSLYIRST
ncbi:hypothetical protein Cgig2_022761 [Carnegiea gigantea]|uniref:Uncharacterized protein n=1 Tax=Carnegiea gigantea TaxID=171969 RepID=A0A9Q1KDE5_9CARY|nr:hypothetical protein Cgig2_022761 [Carnegiea gigantea]